MRTRTRARGGGGPGLSAILALAVLASAGPAAAAPPTAETLDDGHVRAAIDALVAGLVERKVPRDFWDPRPWNPSRDGSKYQGGGYTALAALALLHGGVSYQDPRLRDAIEHLAAIEMEGTYAVALRTSIWSRLPGKFHDWLEADTRWLLDGFAGGVGGWTYTQRPDTTVRDNSVTQFGALALWEASKRGVEIPPAVWRRLEERFISLQTPGGGWDYDGDGNATGSMTTAGLATLFITEDLLHAADAISLREREEAPHEIAARRGLAWMDAHFSPRENPESFRDYYYYVWGVERVGLAGGLKSLGGRDWYRAIAAEVISRLLAWDDETRTFTVNERIGGEERAGLVRTRHLAFGLIFLSRGRVPVAVNKLRIPDFRWNNRPRDAANLTRWITETAETDLSWQVVDVGTDPESWLDAPMLYLASDRALPWIDGLATKPREIQAALRAHERARITGAVDPDEPAPVAPFPEPIRALRRYIELGGTLVAVNEGSSRAFGRSIEAFGDIAFPDCTWRRLDDDDDAYTLYQPVEGRHTPLRALGNGVRDLIVLAPVDDLSASLQLWSPTPPEAPRDHRRGRTGARRADPGHLQTLGNVYFEASEMNRPHPRLEGRNPRAAAAHDGAGPSVRVVRAMYDGNWSPEPAALELLDRHLAAGGGPRLAVRDRPLASIDAIVPAPDLVLVSGTAPHEFTEKERRAIAAYARRGGMILFETAGGRGGFATEAEEMASGLLGAPARTVLRHPVVTGSGLAGGVDCTRVEYRPFALEVFGARETVPRLRAIDVGGDPRVLFSREDLSHGLLGRPAWGVSGYAPAFARALMGNLCRYARSTRADSAEPETNANIDRDGDGGAPGRVP